MHAWIITSSFIHKAHHFPRPLTSLETVPPHVVGSPSCVTNVRTTDRQYEKYNLAKEPQPAAALLAREPLLPATSGGRRRVGLVQILSADRDDVVVVAQLARFGAEAKVGDVGDRWGLVGLKAQQPVVFLLVLQLQLQLLVLEVCQAELGRDGSVPDATRRATCEFLRFAVRVLIVGSLSVANHCHYVGEDCAGSIVLVGVEEDAQALEIVDAAKDRSLLRA